MEALVDEMMFYEADAICIQALEGREKKPGSKHPDTLLSISGLAHVLHKQKRFEEAKDPYRQTCDGLERKLGSQHPKTITYLNRFSHMQQETKQI